MAALQCEICGGRLIGRPGGIFECDSCGMEYDTAWAKTKIQEIKGTVKVEGTVEVTGTVKVEGAVTLPNLITRGYMALESHDYATARDAFGKALEMDPVCGDAHLGIAMATQGYFDRKAYWADLMSHRIEEVPSLVRAKECTLTEPYRTEMDTYLAFLAEEAAKDAVAACRGAENRAYYATLRRKYTAARNMMGNKYYHITVEKGFNMRDPLWQDITAYSREGDVLAGIRPDGSVLINWEKEKSHVNTAPAPKAVKVCACDGGYMNAKAVVILRQDGTVRVIDEYGNEDRFQQKVHSWTQIVDIYAVGKYVVDVIGVRVDGTVVANQDHLVKENEHLTDIAAVAGGQSKHAYLTQEGKVVLSQHTKLCVINSEEPELHAVMNRIEKWTDIIQICFHDEAILGLKADGTVVIEPLTSFMCRQIKPYQNQLGSVRDAVALYGCHVLLKDGYVVTVDELNEVTTDMQLVTTGYGADAPVLRLFNHIDTLEEELRKANEKRVAILRQKQQLEQEAVSLQQERTSLGLFAGKRRKEIETRLAEINNELKELS